MTELELRKLVGRLPAQPGIHRRGSFTENVVLAPFVMSRDGYCLLFEKRAAGIRQGGEISFPGGRFEPLADASRGDAAIREAVEELGVRRDQVRILGQADSMLTHWGAFIDIFIGTVEAGDPPHFAPNPQEVERAFLVPFAYFAGTEPETFRIRIEMQPSYRDASGEDHVLFPARELGLPRHYWEPWSAGVHSVFAYRYEGEVIWGLTADIIQQVVALAR